MKRKSDKEIKMQIVDICWARAESKLIIAKKMVSNWSTIKKHAEELANEGILERVVISDMTGYRVKQIVKDVLFHQWENQDNGLINIPIDINLDYINKKAEEIKQQLKEIK